MEGAQLRGEPGALATGGRVEAAPHFVDEPAPDQGQAWEEIDTGRFMPRRIRGSYRGRALG
jgi:hypothetical protein